MSRLREAEADETLMPPELRYFIPERLGAPPRGWDLSDEHEGYAAYVAVLRWLGSRAGWFRAHGVPRGEAWSRACRGGDQAWRTWGTGAR